MMSAFQAGAIDFSPFELQHIGYSFIITKLTCPYKDPEVASTNSQEYGVYIKLFWYLGIH